MRADQALIYVDIIIYTIIFIILIPIMLFRYNYNASLEAYMPNLDLIATLLTFNKLSFKNLYLSDPDSIHQEISQSFVNYFALLGIGYVIIREALKRQNLYYGLSMGSIMLLMTYISPTLYLSDSMRVVETKYNNIIATIVGIIIVFCLIFIEKQLIERTQKPLSKLFESVLSLKWLP